MFFMKREAIIKSIKYIVHVPYLPSLFSPSSTTGTTITVMMTTPITQPNMGFQYWLRKALQTNGIFYCILIFTNNILIPSQYIEIHF